jgi:hypothetical protein
MGVASGRRLEIVFVLAPTQNAFFFELAEMLGHELTALGVAWRISEWGFPTFGSHRVTVLMPPHEYAVLATDDVALRERAILERTIGICTEQPDTHFFENNHKIIGKLGRVFDISRFAAAESRLRGVPVEHLQLGYSPLLDVYDPEAERDIDVLFVGCRSERRDLLVARLAPVLSRYRCHLAFSDNSHPNPRGASSAAFLWGAAKQRRLARTRVLLNLHQGDTPYFEWQRAVEGICAGAVILTETSAGVAPLVPGEHLWVCRPEAIEHVLPALLADDDRLRTMRAEAYRFLTGRLPMRAGAEALARAAAELAALPSRHGRWVTAMGNVTGIPDDPSAHATDERASLPPIKWSPMAAAVKRLRLDVMELRRRLESQGGPHATTIVHRTAAHRLQGETTVSSITALYNQGEFVGEALDSLALAAGPRTELVIVDDGSTDGSRDVVQRWLEAHEQVPAVLVAHGRNRGLPHARNTALGFSRGEFVFVLDSDNAVLPGCFAALAGALRADREAAFAYPLIERHDSLGPIGLLPPFGWDPYRLRHGNYIDAMAMVRTDVLRRLGGYTTDVRLYGWEDYDLWCRIAEAGLRGVLVPAVLARYRDSGASMRAVIDIDHMELFAVLAERAPRLFAGMLDDGGRA